MFKRKLADTFQQPIKKIKTPIPRKILGGHPYTKQWLVEWDDMTRTWENYDIVKNMYIFRLYLERFIEKHLLSVDSFNDRDISYIN